MSRWGILGALATYSPQQWALVLDEMIESTTRPVHLTTESTPESENVQSGALYPQHLDLAKDVCRRFE